MRFLLTLILLLALPLVAASAAPLQEGRNTAFEFIADRDAVVPGQTFTGLIKVTMRDGWHIYWKNPGDSGDALRLKWTLPQGFSQDDIQWPTPKRLPFGPLVNFGYTEQTLFPVRITPPAHIDGASVTLRARAEILVCEEICIPEFEDISLTMPVAAQNQPVNQALFSAAQDALPAGTDLFGTFFEKDGQIFFNLPSGYVLQPETVFPEEWGIIDNAAAQKVEKIKHATSISVARGSRPLDTFSQLYIVVSDAKGDGLGTLVDRVDPPAGVAMSAPQSNIEWLTAVFFAFLGGLILNLMPCVFPILSLKALKLVSLSDGERSHAQNTALAYTAGILTCFLGFAAVLLVLRGAGETIGWGFQLQSPEIVTVLAWVMVAVGFNLLGFFEINGLQNAGAHLAQGQGLKASFFTGALAAIVATPCTAPFMATALGAALIQPWPQAMLIFMALGLGLAFPFLLLSYVPYLARALPRPGAWMNVFRQILAFPMFAAALWLIWVAVSQTGENALLYILGGVIVLGFVIWAARFKTLASQIALGLAAILLCMLLIMLPAKEMDKSIEKNAFSSEKIDEAIAQNRPVFVNMTAKWCVTCIVNDKVAISVPATQKLFTENYVLYLVGDWTFQDPEITKYLAKYGRSGVPLYILYKDGKSIVLPQLLTPDIIKNAWEKN